MWKKSGIIDSGLVVDKIGDEQNISWIENSKYNLLVDYFTKKFQDINNPLQQFLEPHNYTRVE